MVSVVVGVVVLSVALVVAVVVPEVVSHHQPKLVLSSNHPKNAFAMTLTRLKSIHQSVLRKRSASSSGITAKSCAKRSSSFSGQILSKVV